MSVDIQPGDTIRLTIEGKVEQAGQGWVRVNGAIRDLGRYEAEVLEKAKPPLVRFQRGDYVRHKNWPGSVYLLTDKGPAHLKSGKLYAKAGDWCDKYLTSEFYEKVELHEAPL